VFDIYVAAAMRAISLSNKPMPEPANKHAAKIPASRDRKSKGAKILNCI